MKKIFSILTFLLIAFPAFSQTYIDLSKKENLEKFMAKKWTITDHKRMVTADSAKGFLPVDDYYDGIRTNMLKNQLTFEFLEGNKAKLTSSGTSQEMYWNYNAAKKTVDLKENSDDTWPLTYKVLLLTEDNLILYYFPTGRNELYYFSSGAELLSADDQFRNFVKYGTRLLTTEVFDSHDETKTVFFDQSLRIRFKMYALEFISGSDKVKVTQYLNHSSKEGKWILKDSKLTISFPDTEYFLEFTIRLISDHAIYLDHTLLKKTWILMMEPDRGEEQTRQEYHSLNIPLYFKSMIVENQWKLPEGNSPFPIHETEKNLTVSFLYDHTYEIYDKKGKVLLNGKWDMEYNILFISTLPCYIDTLGIDKCRLQFFIFDSDPMMTRTLLPVKDHRFDVKNNTEFEGYWVMDSLVFLNDSKKFTEEENFQRAGYEALMSRILRAEIKLGEEGVFTSVDRKSTDYSGQWKISADKTKLFFDDDASIQDYVFSIRKKGNLIYVRMADLPFDEKYQCELVLRKK